MGVVYYANYFVWFEVARTAVLRDAGWTYRDMEADGFILPVVEAHCHYQLPARYDDEIDVRTTGSALSLVRLRFDYEVIRCADSVRLAVGHTVHASLDRDGRPCRLPERVRQLFT
jgi:acyl-CoA thioester hydrolase